MKKRIIKSMQAILPNKMLRKQQFTKRIKDRKRHERYNIYSFKHGTKASRFNRWQDYRRMINRSY